MRLLAPIKVLFTVCRALVVFIWSPPFIDSFCTGNFRVVRLSLPYGDAQTILFPYFMSSTQFGVDVPVCFCELSFSALPTDLGAQHSNAPYTYGVSRRNDPEMDGSVPDGGLEVYWATF